MKNFKISGSVCYHMNEYDLSSNILDLNSLGIKGIKEMAKIIWESLPPETEFILFQVENGGFGQEEIFILRNPKDLEGMIDAFIEN